MSAKSPVPASLVSRARAAPLLVLAAAGCAGGELAVALMQLSSRPEGHHPCDMTGLLLLLGLAALLVGTPVLAGAAHLLATRRGRTAAVLLGGSVAATALLGIPVGVGGAFLAAMVPVTMILAVSPLLWLCACTARRDDLEAADHLLAGGAAWLVCTQAATWWGFGLGLGVPAAGMAVGAAIVALASARIVARRRWARRVAGGKVAGLGVRELTASPDPALPRLFPARRGQDPTLLLITDERPALATGPYRTPSPPHAEALAIMPLLWRGPARSRPCAPR